MSSRSGRRPSDATTRIWLDERSQRWPEIDADVICSWADERRRIGPSLARSSFIESMRNQPRIHVRVLTACSVLRATAARASFTSNHRVGQCKSAAVGCRSRNAGRAREVAAAIHEWFRETPHWQRALRKLALCTKRSRSSRRVARQITSNRSRCGHGVLVEICVTVVNVTARVEIDAVFRDRRHGDAVDRRGVRRR